MDLGLTDRVVVVTGGSRGIGRATALAYAAEGAKVAISYRVDEKQARTVLEEISAIGGDAIAVQLDLSDPHSIAPAFATVGERWGGIDVLVANAPQYPDGTPGTGPAFEDVPDGEWRWLLRGELEGTIECIRAALPAMRGRDAGRIVLVSSDLARRIAIPSTWAYGAAKAGFVGLMTGLIAELKGDILVNVVTPGLTLTERNFDYLPPAIRELTAAHTPSRRLSEPEDVARAIVFLGSPANGNITGDVVNVTGGL